MPRITADSLLSLEAYSKQRAQFRARVIAHKKNRSVRLGDCVTLIFEDELTVRYQVQEMLRVERIFEEKGIREELDTYNALVPDGRNLKATMMIEFPDPAERRVRLGKLIGVADRVWIRVEGWPPAWAIADEDLDRDTEEKTSSVHFLRFELSGAMRHALKAGAALSVGVDHPEFSERIAPVSAAVRDSLVGDLE